MPEENDDNLVNQDKFNRITFAGAGGRPPIFDSPEQMQEMIDGYFKGGMKFRKVVVGSGKEQHTEMIPVPTITGLVLYLGFDSRQSFYDYEKKPEFSYTIKKARVFIENEYEEILATTGNAGAIFALKNFSWHDKSEVALSGGYEITKGKLQDFLNDRGGLQDDSKESNSEGSSDTPTDT